MEHVEIEIEEGVDPDGNPILLVSNYPTDGADDGLVNAIMSQASNQDGTVTYITAPFDMQQYQGVDDGGQNVALSDQQTLQIVGEQAGGEVIQAQDESGKVFTIHVTRSADGVETFHPVMEQNTDGNNMVTGEMIATPIKQELGGESFEDSVMSEKPTDSLAPHPEPPPPVETRQPPSPPRPPPKPEPDLTNPIQLSEETIVTVGGKKCFLRVDPETGKLVAYPAKQENPLKKRRGRPKKSDLQRKAVDVNAPLMKRSDPTSNSAAESLLELSSSVGPDGIRRSGRARKKAPIFEDYEVGKVEHSDFSETSSEEEGFPEDEFKPERVMDPNTPRRPRGRPRKNPGTPPPLPQGIVKRGRGRPRRYPPPGTQPTVPSMDLSGPIPAIIIPNPGGGQTIMLAPGQSLQSLQNRPLPKLLPKTTDPSQVPVVVQTSDGGTRATTVDTGVILSAAALSATTPISSSSASIILQPDGSTAETILASQAIANVEDNTQSQDEEATGVEPVENSEICENLPTVDDQMETTELGDAELKSVTDVTEDDTLQPSMVHVHVSKDVASAIMAKANSPAKLGLKTSEDDLEKLKCNKCEFQAFYYQQYQNHLNVAHPDDIEKCKCCSFVSFDKDELLTHFKQTHPRNICDECGIMAEYAYVIKRHMMRHNSVGCECHICGKRYKDQYILKMHVKMVHLPAEVLFECTVCAKKFTRKAHLKRHLRIHEPMKPFKCPDCDYRGCEKSDISKHMLIHEEPKYTCDICGKAFRHFKNMELHLKRHNGQRDYKCGVCDFYGYTFTDIRKHIERKHSDKQIDIRTFGCDKCGFAFKTDDELKEHQKQNCDLLMIEQALVAATSSGGETTTISIPEGQVTIDGQQIISVEQVTMPDGTTMNLTTTEAQLAELGDGQIIGAAEVGMVTEVAVSEAQLTEVSHIGIESQVGLVTTGELMEEDLESATHVVTQSEEPLESEEPIESEEQLEGEEQLEREEQLQTEDLGVGMSVDEMSQPLVSQTEAELPTGEDSEKMTEEEERTEEMMETSDNMKTIV